MGNALRASDMPMAERTPELRRVIGNLNESTGLLEITIERLYSRLTPILSKSESLNEKNVSASSPFTTEMANIIGDEATKIVRMSNTLDDIIRKLEI